MNRVPKHVSIIMDGNGRWAKQRGLERLEGHRAGVDSVRESLEYAGEVGIEYLSLFAFSSENWGRPQKEVDGLMELMVDSIVAEKERLMENDVIFKVIGDRERLSKRVLEKIVELEDETANNGRVTLIVFLSYSGKWDIVHAVEQLLERAKKGEKIELNEQYFNSLLSTSSIPDPDLVIRTSGEQRISNYMLWQTAYSELYFTETLWPDFRKKEFEKALNEYKMRDRRYGKVEE